MNGRDRHGMRGLFTVRIYRRGSGSAHRRHCVRHKRERPAKRGYGSRRSLHERNRVGFLSGARAGEV
jgi:hypothetical protein